MSTVAEPSYRRRIGYQAGLLGGFATLAGALLILGNIATHEAITERQAEDLLDSLSQVVPATLHDNDLLADTVDVPDASGRPVTVYRALRDGSLTGFAWDVTGQGYAGTIRLIVAIRPDGTVLGVRVLSHAETPGLGDRIEIEKDDWILGFNGRSLQNTPGPEWRVQKDGGRFDQFSGATITPRGVVRAVYEGLQFYEAHRDALSRMAAGQQTAGHRGKEIR